MVAAPRARCRRISYCDGEFEAVEVSREPLTVFEDCSDVWVEWGGGKVGVFEGDDCLIDLRRDLLCFSGELAIWKLRILRILHDLPHNMTPYC